MSDVLNIEVVYALPRQQHRAQLRLKPGSTLRDAVEASGFLQGHPEIDLSAANKVGIYGKLVSLDTALRDRDRVEIYRPLIADAKQERRRRAQTAKATKK